MHVIDSELNSQESLDDNIVINSTSSSSDDDSFSPTVNSLNSFNLQPKDGDYSKFKRQLECDLRIGSAYYIGTSANPSFTISDSSAQDVNGGQNTRSRAFMRHPFNLLLAREQGDIGPSSKSRRLRYRASRWITDGSQRFDGLQIYGHRQKGALYPDSQTFQENVQGSLWAVTRLHLENKFECHRGCVNTLNFNSRGNLIASGSDDLKVVVTNWITGEQAWSYRTGHCSNIFHVKFIPESNDLQIVSCGCDSEVRLAHLSPTGGLACPTRLLVKHNRACHKLSIPNGEPNIVLSAGADGRVFSTDLRIPKAHRLLWLPFSEFFSIASNPSRSHELALCGRSESIVRIYDRRKIDKGDPNSGLLHTIGADHLRGNRRQSDGNNVVQANRQLINSCRNRFRSSIDSDSDSDSDSNNLLNSLSVQLGRRIRAVLNGLRGRARAALLLGNNSEDSFSTDPSYNFEVTKYSVTAAVYSAQGDAILLSYNDENIYLFDVNQSNKPYLHKYSGHRNMQTIVGATFFGPNSEYVVSGSDDGYFYLWDRESEGIIQWLHADIDGAVNVIESHPTLPVLASAGLDYDFK
ncbi:DDB1- and CUL4-associated factor 8, partial [Schistosoma japonicum]